jgi:hypothetical protein
MFTYSTHLLHLDTLNFWLPFTPVSTKLFSTLFISIWNVILLFRFCCECDMFHFARPLLIEHPNNIMWRVQIIKLIIMQTVRLWIVHWCYIFRIGNLFNFFRIRAGTVVNFCLSWTWSWPLREDWKNLKILRKDQSVLYIRQKYIFLYIPLFKGRNFVSTGDYIVCSVLNFNWYTAPDIR